MLERGRAAKGIGGGAGARAIGTVGAVGAAGAAEVAVGTAVGEGAGMAKLGKRPKRGVWIAGTQLGKVRTRTSPLQLTP